MMKLGYVEYLTTEQKDTITGSRTQYFIPWWAVWNSNSFNTPCRLAFDASQVTAIGNSLNSVLAKERYIMNK